MIEQFEISLSTNDIKEKFIEIKNLMHIDSDKKTLSIDSVDDLIKLISTLSDLSKPIDNDTYFKSKKHRLAFLILHHEGGVFDEELGIKKKHYLDEKLAKEWKSKYTKIFHPDKNIGDNALNYAEVMQKINKIYDRMVGEA